MKKPTSPWIGAAAVPACSAVGLAIVAAAALLCSAPAAHAVTVYTINTTITSAAPTGNPLQTDSVVGTLTTDGTLGALRAPNILGWNLNLIDRLNGANNTLLTNGNSLLVSDGGGALSASATGLFFDFSARGEFLIQIRPYSGYDYFCFSTGGACAAGETISPGNVFAHGVTLTGTSAPIGNQPLDPGANLPVAAVPEPSTWATLALGLVGVSLVRRRRRSRRDDRA